MKRKMKLAALVCGGGVLFQAVGCAALATAVAQDVVFGTLTSVLIDAFVGALNPDGM